MRFAPLLFAVFALAACGRDAGVNPPTEPAQPIAAPGAPPPVQPNSSVAPMLPGAGPASFVGRWSARPEWCAFPQGSNRPIEITPLRFEGYENSCSLDTIDQQVDGYVAALTCAAEGQTRHERVRMVAEGQTLSLTWLDRGGPPVQLTKCTTLKDTTTRAPGPSL